MLQLAILILLSYWLLGLISNVAGPYIHTFLVLALAVYCAQVLFKYQDPV